MSTLPGFLYAIALTAMFVFGGHYYWVCQYGANFNPAAILDTTQAIDGGSIYELFGV